MRKGRRFSQDGITYYVFLVGPVSTLCKAEDGTLIHFNTHELREILEAEQCSQ